MVEIARGHKDYKGYKGCKDYKDFLHCYPCYPWIAVRRSTLKKYMSRVSKRYLRLFLRVGYPDKNYKKKGFCGANGLNLKTIINFTPTIP